MHDLKTIQHIGLAGAKGEALVYMLIMRPQLWGARGGRGGGKGCRVLLFLILVTLGADIPYPKSSKNVRPKSKRACRGGVWGEKLDLPATICVNNKNF